MKNKTEFVRNIYTFEGKNKILIEDNDDKISSFLSNNYTIKNVIISSIVLYLFTNNSFLVGISIP